MALVDYFGNTPISTYAKDADLDSDAISIEYLVEGEEGDGDDVSGHRDPLDGELVEGALVFIKGDAAVREFRAWAKSRGYLTEKSWRGAANEAKC